MPPRTRSATSSIATRTRSGKRASAAQGPAVSKDSRGRVQKTRSVTRRRLPAATVQAPRQRRGPRVRAGPRRLTWHWPNLPFTAVPPLLRLDLRPALPSAFTSPAEQPTRSFCGICYTQVPVDSSDSLGCCKARFCKACLLRYLKGKVQDRSYPIRCPHFCPSRTVGLATLKRYLTKEEVERHKETQVEKAVPAESRYYCPNPHCSRVIGRRGTSRRVTCPTCKAVACCTCREAWHGSQRCRQAVQQQPGRQELSLVAKQLSFTRCDVCGAGVERTEGCTQMTCACGHMFDWGRNLGLI